MISKLKPEDWGLVSNLLASYLPLHGFDAKEFVENRDNVCLLKGGDLSLFEKVSESLYEGHYFFESRGKEALRVAQEMLAYFIQKFEPQAIKGLTPLEHLGARWLSRKLGFKGYGVVQTPVGPCELFILTKKDWENTLHE